MKKFLLLCLAVVGMTSTASAVKLYVYVAQSANFWPNADARIMAHVWEGDENFQVEMTKEIKYGNLWYSCELNGKTNVIIVRQDPAYGTTSSIDWDHLWARTGDITVSTTEDTYGELWHNDDENSNGVWTGTSVRPGTQWSGLIIRDSYVGFDGNEANTATTDYNTFTKTYTKAEIESKAAAGEKFYFKFKHVDGVIFDEAGTYREGQWKEIHVSSDTELPFGTSTDATEQTYENGGNSWYITVPSYDYDHIVFTAAYVNENGSYKWQISADAFISVTTNANGYRTFVSPCPLTISDATAYYATDDNDGTATAHAITNPAASTPMLIKGDASTPYSFQVVASGTDYSETNAFHAGSGSALDSYTEGEGYNYILNGDTWYAAAGRTVGTTKAYLQLAAQAPAHARVLKFADDEATGINVIEKSQVSESYFDLQGRRVAQPTKGLYIVNGKKVIMK